MAGFLTNPNNKKLSILFYDQNIKPLLFPNLFPYGKGVYTGHPIINETKTTTVPSYIRTGDFYFHQKEHHINTMVQGFNVSQIFYTVIMVENHWTHLHKILSKTDNKNTLPSNRPLHTYLP
ncbi:hypothetical protein C1645_840839 [Glomus cerebriforme]|uniref:Uncharacterized protein n=1 Tax=Glomus cerebriforme TaxID=658196 RepID=A0A397S3T7_9GLOM|nr:hypothetical protein C1645_840839 [Glomus cerebriforme]